MRRAAHRPAGRRQGYGSATAIGRIATSTARSSAAERSHSRCARVQVNACSWAVRSVWRLTPQDPSATVARIRSGHSSCDRPVRPCSVGTRLNDGFEALGVGPLHSSGTFWVCSLPHPGHNYATAGFLGRPPSFPFAREAAAFAGDLVSPPDLPMIPAIHFREPSVPSSSAGKYRSAFSFGK